MKSTKQFIYAVAIVAAALSGCQQDSSSGDDDGTGGDTPPAMGGAMGMGGGSGAGGMMTGTGGMMTGTGGMMSGTGGMAGPDPMDCGEMPTYNLNEQGEVDGTTFTLSGTTGNRSTTAGSCSTDGRNGSEAAVVFTAPEAGEWEIRTIRNAAESAADEDQVDTLIYARSSCSDPATEIDCNDDIELGRILKSKLRLVLQADQTVYVIVDHWAGEDEDDFIVRAQPYVPTEPPVITTGNLVIDNEANTVGYYFEGSDAEDDVALARFNLFREDGQGVLGEDGNGFTITLGETGNGVTTSLEKTGDGNFFAIVYITFNATSDLSQLTSGAIIAVDMEGNNSEPFQLEPEEPMVVERGADCNYVTLTCDEESVCVEGACADPDSVRACPDDWEVTNIEADAEGSATVMGSNAGIEEGSRRGATCGEYGGAGQSAIFTYTAPEDGTYLVTADTASANSDPALFARRLCDYTLGAMGRDIACNTDRAEGDTNSTIAAELTAGETIFLFVDSQNVPRDTDGDGELDTLVPGETGDFTLTVSKANAPVVSEAAVYYNAGRNTIGGRATWTDSEDDVLGLFLTFLDAEGAELEVVTGITRGFINFNEEPAANEDGSRTGVFSLDFNQIQNVAIDFGTVATIRFELVDVAGLNSDPADLEWSDPPVLEADAPCDPLGVLDQCGEGQGCIDEDPDDMDPPNCVNATAPVITGVTIHTGVVNGRETLALNVEGTDAEEDVIGFFMTALDAEGEVIGNRQGPSPFDNLMNVNGNEFTASGVYTTAVPANMATIRIELIDRSFLLSDPVEVGVSDPTPIGVGEACANDDITSDCADALCLANEGGEGSSCQQPESTCPAGWGAIPALAGDGEGAWTYAGDTTDAADLDTEGSCGGGGRHHGVASFTAPADGQYACSVDAGDEDTVLYARSHCGIAEEAAEVACNDDAAEGADLPDYASRVYFDAAAEDMVYLIVDGFGGGFEAAYTLRCYEVLPEPEPEPEPDPEEPGDMPGMDGE